MHIHVYVYTLIKHLLVRHCLGITDIAENKTCKLPGPRGAYMGLGGRQVHKHAENHQISMVLCAAEARARREQLRRLLGQDGEGSLAERGPSSCGVKDKQLAE